MRLEETSIVRVTGLPLLLVCLAGLGVIACNVSPGTEDSGAATDSGQPDSGLGDSGPTSDGGSLTDGGDAGVDAGDAGIDSGFSADQGQSQVSRTLQLSADGGSLWVVNTESDSISQIDVATLSLTQEILLAPEPPAVSPTTNRYEPAVRPRAITLVDALHKAYVAGQAANAVYVVDTNSATVLTIIPVPAEPTAVVSTSDGRTVYVVSHEGNSVEEIDTQTDSVTATLPVNEHPWGASLRADGSLLYVSYLLLGPGGPDAGYQPGITVIDTATFTVSTFTVVPTQPVDPSGSLFIPSGQVRGEYTVVPRPNSGELWVPHLLLATTTAQPALAFDTTAFPTITWLSPGGGVVDNRVLFQAPGAPQQSFIDSCSGPHDIAFTPDGNLALVTMAQSEDVMVFDANSGYEVGLVRPTLGSLLEGIVIDATGTHAYVHGRSSVNITVLDISQSSNGPLVTLDPGNGDAGISTVESDPMPPNLRNGFQIFYSANSAKRPITQNFWMACATCHLEGQSDAVTWQFLEGPRDTPSNAGGPINTGFLFRQATRNEIEQYDETIQTEQGGSYFLDGGSAQQLSDLMDLANFVNYAIPFPQNPNVSPDGGLTEEQDAGMIVFQTIGCTKCHQSPNPFPVTGNFFTDSGSGNPTLDLCAGPVMLHNVGTGVTTGQYQDQPMVADDCGVPRLADSFDTPTLRGIFATAPYLHDGSAATLDAVVEIMVADAVQTTIDASDEEALVAYLKTL
jgi:YVTN family beta-propeller protein